MANISYKKTFTPRKGYSIKEALAELNDTDFLKYLMQMEGKILSLSLEPKSVKSEKQRMYAYYQKVVLGIAVIFFTDMGWEAMDKNKADEMLKDQCACIPIYNSKTDQKKIVREEKSRMPKDRLRKYIVDCIFFLEENGYKVPESGEYINKQRTGMDGFKEIK